MKKSILLFIAFFVFFITQINASSNVTNRNMVTEFWEDYFKGLVINTKAPLSPDFNSVAVVTTFPFVEGFEQTTVPLADWTMVYANQGHPSGNDMKTVTDYKYAGSRSFRFSSFSSGSPYNQYLITPELDLGGRVKKVRFYHRGNTSSIVGYEIFSVGTSTTGNNIADFTWGSDVAATPSSWNLYEMEINDPLVKYVAIQYKPTGSRWYLYIDNFEIDDPVTCVAPLNLAVSNILTTSAKLNWTVPSIIPSNGYEIYYSTSSTPPTMETVATTSVAAGITEYNMIDLNSSTYYYVWVRSNCGEGDLSKWITTPLIFKTDQIPVNLPYTCNFANGNPENNIWTLENGSQTNKWYIGNATTTPNIITEALYISNDGGTSNAYGNTASYVYAYRTINFDQTGIYSVDFDWRANGEANNDLLRAFLVPNTVVLTAGDANAMTGSTNTTPTNWIALDGGKLELKSEWQSKHTEVNISTAGVYKLVYFWKNNASTLNQPPAAVDNIEVKAITCPMITNITTSAIQDVEAIINWTANSETKWNVIVSPTQVTDFTAAIKHNVISEPIFRATGLSAFTTYYVYVQAVCDETTFSAWSNVINFTTTCAPVIIPMVEGFNTTATSEFPSCWKQQYVSGTKNITFEASGSSPTVSNPLEGTRMIYWNSASGNENQTRLVSIPISTSTLSGVDVEFWWYNSNSGTETTYTTEGVQVQYSTDGGITWTNSGNFIRRWAVESGWVVKNVSIAGLSSYDRILVGLLFTSNAGYNCYLDYLQVKPLSGCVAPTNIVLDSRTTTTANISWTASISEPTSGYQVYYNNSSTAPIASTVPNAQVEAGVVNYEITGLTASTFYHVWVRSNCGEGSTSEWSQAMSFYTKQVPADLPYTCNFETTAENRVWSLENGAQTNKWYIGSISGVNNGSGSRGMYISNNNGANNSYDITKTSYVYAYRTINVNSTGIYNIKFDWKSNGESSNDIVRAFLVPASVNLLAGDHYGMNGSINTVPTNFIELSTPLYSQGSWQSFSNDIIIDGTNNLVGTYNLVFFWKNNASSGTQAPAIIDNISFRKYDCAIPTEVAVNTIRSTTATVVWTSGFNETKWNIIVSETPVIDFESAAKHTVTVNPEYHITGLTQVTEYYIYVQAVCDSEEGIYSDWTSAVSFTTTVPLGTIPYVCDFSDATENRYWALANGTQTNKWYIGSTTTGTYSVTEGLYISNNNGASNAYGNTISYVYAYRPIIIDQAGIYLFNFDWRTDGESTWDLLRAFLIPANIDLNAGVHNGMNGSNNPTPNGWISLDNNTKMNLKTSWQYVRDREVNVTTPGIYNLVFFWKNDDGGDYPPSAAVDNVSIAQKSSCAVPTNLVVSDITTSSGTLSWTIGDTETEWNIIKSTTPISDFTGITPIHTSINLDNIMTGLNANTTYYIYVQAICGEDNNSSWVPVILTTSLACPKPTNVAVSNIVTTTATISWVKGFDEAEWNVIISPTIITDFAEVTPTATVSDITYPATGLTPTTTYYVYVQAVCDNEEGIYSDWTSVVSFTTNAPLGTIPYICDFSDISENNNWILANGTQANKWYIGNTTTATNAVDKGLYISDDNGASNKYKNTASYVYAYRSINIEESGTYYFNFDWRANGESTYDLLRAFLIPSSVILSAGDAKGMTSYTNTVPTGWTSITGPTLLEKKTTWQEIRNRSVNITTPGVYNLVFFWKNDSGSDYQPPAAVDNISIVKCLSPSNIIVSNITTTTANIAWTKGGTESEWDIIISPTVITDFTVITPTDNVTGTTGTYPATDLTPNTTYYVYVKSICGLGNSSIWTSAVTFTTLPTCPKPSNIVVNNITSATSDITWTKGGTESEWNIIVSSTEITDFSGITPTANVSGENLEYPAADLSPNTTYYFYIQAVCGTDDRSVWTPAVEFTTLPTCLHPVAVTVTTITGSSAIISWTKGANETEWNIIVSDVPVTDFESATIHNVTDVTPPAYQALGLNFLTSYYVYLQAVCGEEDNSVWTEAVTFTTDCGMITSFPFFEGFNETTMPNCWTILDLDGDSYKWATSSSDITPYEGSRYTRIRWNSNQNNDWLISPKVKVGDDLMFLEFWARSVTTGSFLEDFNVLISKTGKNPSDFTISLQEVRGTPKVWTKYLYNLKENHGLNSGDEIYIAIRCVSQDDYYLGVDAFKVYTTNNNNDIITFTLDGQTGPAIIDATNHTVSIEVGANIDQTNLAPTISVSPSATINPASGEIRDFTNPVTYTVIAQSGDEQEWTVTVTRLGVNTENDILTFAIPNQESNTIIDSENHTVLVKMPYGTDLTNLVPTISISTYATIDPLSGTAIDFTNPKIYTVIAENGDEQEWEVTITNVAISTENDILTFVIPQQVSSAIIDNVNHTVSIVVRFDADITDLIPEITVSPFANLSPISGISQNFENPLIYTITAQNGDEQEWTITVTNAAIPLGANCSNPIIVDFSSDIPYVVTEQSTCELGDQYRTVCLSNNGRGEDAVYRLDVTDPVYATFELNPNGTQNVIMSIYDDCPDAGTNLNCLVSTNGSTISFDNVLYAGTYYLVLDLSTAGTCIDDYDLTITALTNICRDVTNFVLDEVTQHNATISWTRGFVETKWNVKYGTPGFDVETEGTLDEEVTANPYEITGLLLNTNYDVYVQAICDETTNSSWVGPINFTTLVECPMPDNIVISNIEPTSAVISWNRYTVTEWSFVISNTFISDPDLSTNIITISNDSEYNAMNLTPNTKYYVYIKSNCLSGDSYWTYATEFWTPQTPAELPYTYGFESDSENLEWTLTNGTQTNKWYIGNVVHNQGSKGLYISANDGLINNYVNTTSYVYAYRTINITNEGSVVVSFNWKSNGENNADLLRVFLVPATTSLDAGNAYNMTGTTNITPAGWINVGGLLQLKPTWQLLTEEIGVEHAGLYNLVFFWKNNSSTLNNVPAAVDNISIQQLSCPRPTNLVASNITDAGALVKWEKGGTENEWAYYISEEEIIDFSGILPTGEVQDTFVNLTTLNQSTDYYVYVRAKCSDVSNSRWSYAITFKTKQTPASIPYVCNFDTGNPENSIWTLENGNKTNKWYIGTTISGNSSITEGLYISNNNGESNSYTISPESARSYVYAYRTLSITEAGYYLVNFDWRANGETSYTTPQDYMRAFLVPSDIILSAGNETGITATNTPTGWISLDNNTQLNLQSSWQEIRDREISVNTSGLYNLVFYWRNDHSIGTQPPAAIDNISISYVSCPNPISVIVNNITHNSAKITWTSRGSEQDWNVIVSQTEITDFTGVTPTGTVTNASNYSALGLEDNAIYYVYVQAACGTDDNSMWTTAVTFRTLITPASIPYEYDFSVITENSNWIFANGTQTNKWYIGSTTTGTNTVTDGLYVSNNSGTSNVYGNTTSYVYAYRRLDMNQIGYYSFDFDWRANGETSEDGSKYDLLRAFLVPEASTSQLTAGTSNGMSSDVNTTPSGWIDIDGGVLNGFDTWQSSLQEIAINTPGIYNLVFFWKNDNNSGEQPPAAIDNISVMKLTCPRPIAVNTTAITDVSATITWTNAGAETEWNIIVSSTPVTDFGTALTHNVTGTAEYPATGLTQNTIYYIYVQAVCDVDENSNWTEAMLFKTLITPASIPYEHNFSDVLENNSWVLANGTQTNKWFIGSTTTGTNAVIDGLYVSNDNGASNTYSNTTSYLYAYRNINFITADYYSIDFDWRANGELNADLLRAFLVPESVLLEIGANNGMTGTTNTTPSGWISLDGGKLELQNTWQSKHAEVNITTTGVYNLVFFWKNNGTTANQPPAAIDNLSVQAITCPQPTMVTATAITDVSATITWTNAGAETEWNIIVSPTPVTDFGTALTHNVTGTAEYPATGLTQNTIYYVYVQAVCGVDENSNWTETMLCKTLITPASIPYEHDFSDVLENNSWVLANGTQTNKWFIGSTTTGTNTVTDGLYVSNDNGASNTYSNTTSYLYAYRNINFITADYYSIDFDWRANGEANTDLLRAFLVPESVLLESGANNGMSGTTNTTPTGWISLDGGNLELQNTWQSKHAEVNITTTGVYNLVFFWKNNGTTLNQPPAAIDNIEVKTITCPQPTIVNIPVATITGSSAIINWTKGSDENEWNIIVSDVPVTDFESAIIHNVTNVTPPTYQALGLNPITTYYVYVQALCSEDNSSVWTETIMFQTTCPDAYNLPFSENFNTLTSGIPDCWDNSEGTTTTNSYKWNYYTTGYEGVGLRFNSYNNTSGLTNILKTPVLNLSTVVGNAQLSFMYKNPAGGDFSVYISTDGGLTYTTALATGLTNQTTWMLKEIDITDYVGNNNVVIVFKGTSNFAPLGYDGYIYLDNVVVREISNANDILSFELSDQTGSALINVTDHTVNIEVAYGVDLSNLMPTITVSPFATINPVSGANTDFTIPQIYTVTAESGLQQEWEVTVTNALNSANDILTFVLAEETSPATINVDNHTVNIEVEYGTDITNLTPTITISADATINPASGIARDFTNTQTYTVIAANGGEQEWMVTVSVNPGSSANDLVSFVLGEQACSAVINAVNHTVSIAVVYATNLINLTPSITISPLATIEPAIGTPQNFTNPVTYTIISQNGIVQNWVITVVALPEVICPSDMSVTVGSITTFEGFNPIGGTFSGTGVIGNTFDATGLQSGDYTVEYKYTEPLTGCESSCDFIVSIHVGVEITNGENIEVYPNPNSGEFSIQFIGIEGKTTYQILDTKGSIILEEAISVVDNSLKNISLDLLPGVYYVKITTEKQTIVEKMIIQ